MRNAECGISRQGRFWISATVHDCCSAYSAFRTPHSALPSARGSEDRMSPAARTRDPGRFGPYVCRYVPETLMAALEELDRVHEAAKRDPSFWTELNALLKDYVGRPTPLTEAPRLGEQVGAGVVVALKREDLNHTGAHKINNTLGQALLARRMGKRRIIAETGAGQHGVATATVCALRARMRRLHGGGRHAAATPQRVPHGADGRQGGARDRGDEDAEGRDQRGAARLGHERYDHALHHRVGGGPGSVHTHRARLPVRD